MIENNSIRLNLNEYSMTNEIRLLLSTPKYNKKTMLILEGLDDIKLFSRLMCKNDTILFESYGGKVAIKHVLNKRFFNEKRVIGIVDRDYDKSNMNSQLFFCDYCNAEMMVVSNNESLNFTLFNISNKYMNVEALRNTILLKLVNITAIRKLNEQNEWGLLLHDIPINEIFKVSTEDKLMRTIKFINYKNKLNSIDDKRLKSIIDEVKYLKNQNLLNYTSGHDFCKLLLRELKNEYSTVKNITSINADEFEAFLRAGYQRDNFEETELYKRLKNYQERNNLKIVV